MRSIKIGAISLAVFLVCLSVFSRESEQKVIARVNGTVITEKDLEEKVNAAINRTFFHRNLPPEKEKEIKKKSLETLIEEELFFQEAKRQRIRIDKDKIESEYEKIRRRFPSEREFKRALKSAGYSAKTFKKKIERELLVKEVYQRNIIDQNILTEPELRDYYTRHKSKFKKPPTVDLQILSVRVKQPALDSSWQEALGNARDLLKRLESGEDFAALAAQYSADRYRVKGGRLGEVHRGRLPREIEEAAFAMEKGRISPPIKTIKGYSLIKLLDKKGSRQLEFDEVRDKLKKELEQKRAAEAKKRWLTRLKKESKIEIYIDFQ